MSKEFDFGSLKTKKAHPPVAPPKLIKKQDLKPPKPPKQDIEQNDNAKDFVDKVLTNYATSSDHYRDTYFKVTGKSWRGTNEGLIQALFNHYKELEEFKEFKQEINMIIKQESKEIGRGNTLDRKALISELKIYLQDRKAKFEELN